jgi:hypothetical protein
MSGKGLKVTRGADRFDAGTPAALCEPAHGADGLERRAEGMRVVLEDALARLGDLIEYGAAVTWGGVT